MNEEWNDISPQLINGIVDQVVIRQFKSSEEYGHISSMEWLKECLLKLDILFTKNECIKIFIDGEMRLISTEEEFHSWIKKELPVAYKCFFENEHPHRQHQRQ